MTTTATQKANYITNLVKSVDKDINYALSIVCWYTMTDREQKEVEEIIKQNFKQLI
jgi:pyrroloquinoline quinone (PQQ) biosynthesis protein C